MSGVQPFVCVGNVLNVVVCPDIIIVVFGMIISLLGGDKSLLRGLFVSGSLSYNLNKENILNQVKFSIE